MRRIVVTAATLAAALLVAAAVLLVAGHDPLLAFVSLLDGCAGSPARVVETLVAATPLCLCGIAVAISFRAGLFNIGAEGQYLAGAAAAAAVGLACGAGAGLLAIPLVLVAGAAGGSLLGASAGWLRVRREVPEVLSTILLNFVVAEAVVFLLQGPIQGTTAGGNPETDYLPAAARIGHLEGTRLHAGILLLVLVPLAFHVLLRRTGAGLLLRASGDAPEAVRFAGFSLSRLRLSVMACSGAVAGLAGALQLSAVTGFLSTNFSSGTGFAAIAVALVGRLQAAGILAAALFFGALAAGSDRLQTAAGVPAALVRVIEAVAIVGALAAHRFAATSASPGGAGSASAGQRSASPGGAGSTSPGGEGSTFPGGGRAGSGPEAPP